MTTGEGQDARSRRETFAPWNDPTAQPFVVFDNVTKRFGAVTAVDRLSLEIHRGEFFALLGPSGCGKTTLLRMLAGFEIPDEGRVLLDGKDIATVPPYRRPVNMMFQSYALFPHLTVESNVAFGLKQDGLPREEIAARVREMLAMVKLEGLSGRKPHQLSGGQRQRVALARALVKRPKVLLLDEPLAALDRKLRGETRFELMELQARLALTFVIVTHDREEAMTVADRIAVMDHGHIVQVATPGEIYERPRSRFIADFIGEVNLIEGRLISTALGSSLVDTIDGIRLAVGEATDAARGDPVWVAVRPEKMRLSRAAPEQSQANSFAGQVIDIGYLGDFSVYKIRLDNGLVMKALVANVTRLVERPIGWHDRIWLSWPSDASILLNR